MAKVKRQRRSRRAIKLDCFAKLEKSTAELQAACKRGIEAARAFELTLYRGKQ
jgi:hypothetical protein